MTRWLLILLAPFLGGLLVGFERKVRARMQRRVGPPILQPFYDALKLFDKRLMMVNSAHAFLGIMHFVAVWFALGVLLAGGDLLLVVFLHAAAVTLLVLAAFSVRSVYSHLGGNRQALAAVAYEPFYLILAICFYMLVGSFQAGKIMEYPGLPLAQLPLVFLGYLLILPVKLAKSPFDVTTAHQEIVGGAEIEYSGGFYEAVYTAHWLDAVYAYGFVFLFAGGNVALGLALCAGVFLLVNLVDNATARVGYQELLQWAWLVALPLAVLNLVWLMTR